MVSQAEAILESARETATGARAAARAADEQLAQAVTVYNLALAADKE
jgi:hypothetical protein